MINGIENMWNLMVYFPRDFKNGGYWHTLPYIVITAPTICVKICIITTILHKRVFDIEPNQSPKAKKQVVELRQMQGPMGLNFRIWLQKTEN